MPEGLARQAPIVVPLVIPERSPTPGREVAKSDGVDWGPAPADSGERRLMLAVLTDGIGDALGARGRRATQAHRDAILWLEDMDYGRMPFRWLCEGLGIEPSRVQQAILSRVHS